MHMAQLITCGADAVCPWGALDDAEKLGAEGGLSAEEARSAYITALRKGCLLYTSIDSEFCSVRFFLSCPSGA